MARQAGQAKLSLSTFIKKVSLGQEVKSFEHQNFRRELLRVNADMGRLGGLLKLIISSPGVDKKNVNNLLLEITKRQNEIKELVASI